MAWTPQNSAVIPQQPMMQPIIQTNAPISGQMALPNSNDFDFGSGDFTVDGWFYSTNVAPGTNIHIIAQTQQGTAWNTNSIAIMIYQSKLYGQIAYSDNTGEGFAGITTLSPNTWYHVALVRNGTDIRLYLNGVSENYVTSSKTIPNSSYNLTIGSDNAPTQYFYGYIDELRISKGLARWTSNFTPPTSAYTSTGSTIIFK